MAYGALVGVQTGHDRSLLPGPTSCPPSPYEPQPHQHNCHPSATQPSDASEGYAPELPRRAPQAGTRVWEQSGHGNPTHPMGAQPSNSESWQSCDGLDDGPVTGRSLTPHRQSRCHQGSSPRQASEAAWRASSAEIQGQPDGDSRRESFIGVGADRREAFDTRQSSSSTDGKLTAGQWHQHGNLQHGRQCPDATSRLDTYLQGRPAQSSRAGPASDKLRGSITSLPADDKQQLGMPHYGPGGSNWMPSRQPPDHGSAWRSAQNAHPDSHDLQASLGSEQGRSQEASGYQQAGTGGAGQASPSAHGPRSRQDPVTKQGQGQNQGPHSSASHDAPRMGEAGWQGDEGTNHGSLAGVGRGCQRPDKAGLDLGSQVEDEGCRAAWRIKALPSSKYPVPSTAAQQLLHGRPYATEQSTQVNTVWHLPLSLFVTMHNIHITMHPAF